MLRYVSQVFQQHVAGITCPGLLNVLKCYCDQLSEAVCSVLKKIKKKRQMKKGRSEGRKGGERKWHKNVGYILQSKVNSSGDNSI